MHELAELEIAGPDTRFKEEGVGNEVGVGTLSSREFKSGDCFAEATSIELLDQTVLKELRVVDGFDGR